MTIQEAMDKAVEGGYHLYGSDGMDTDYEGATNDYSAWTRKDNASSFIVPTEETFLDPHFWQALGRALGWDGTGSVKCPDTRSRAIFLDVTAGESHAPPQ